MAFLNLRCVALLRTTRKPKLKELEELPRKERGSKPLLPFVLNEKVLSMIKYMKQAGCAVNHNIALAIAKRIVSANDRSLKKKNGNSLELSYTWCQSLFR